MAMVHANTARQEGNRKALSSKEAAGDGGGGATPNAAATAATFWTPFFRLAIVPEFCSSVVFPEILVICWVFFVIVRWSRSSASSFHPETIYFLSLYVSYLL